MKKKVGKVLYWTPRILSIIFILFIAVFSLDVFEPGLSIFQILIGLFMHNIPTFVLIAILVISWKREIVGAIAFALAGLLYISLTVVRTVLSDLPWYLALSWSLTVAGPAFLIGFLFYFNWKRKKK